MTFDRENHLTEEQVTDILIGEKLGSACATHLQQCAACRERVSLFTDAVGSFNAASLAWAESRPAVSLRVRALHARRQAMWAPVGWALLAAAALLIGVPVWQHEHRESAAGVMASAGAGTYATGAQENGVQENGAQETGALAAGGQDSPAQIAADNRMMAQVNVALGTEQESPLREYGMVYEGLSREKQHGEAKAH